MSADKQIVLDSNILLRAVFGTKALGLIRIYGGSVLFYAPDICFSDMERHIPAISQKRGIAASFAFDVLTRISDIVQVVENDLYSAYEVSARKRIGHRDMDDWPIVATALFLNCPVWTEDRDFFGTGIATWTSQTVELYLKSSEQSTG